VGPAGLEPATDGL